MLRVENLNFSYGNREILKDINFFVEKGELVSVLGQNGVGKSTLFRCILGILNDYTGKIVVCGDDVRKLDPKTIAGRIAYIPQSQYPTFNYSVFDMVLMGTTGQFSAISTPGKKHTEEAENALEQMGIADLRNRGFRNISGGERQLVLMARAFAQNAKLWLLDEPTANLDFGNQMKVMSKLKELTEKGYLVVQSTHNPEQTFWFSDRILALKDGRILACGNPRQVATEEIMSQIYQIDVEICNLRNGDFKVCLPKKI